MAKKQTATTAARTISEALRLDYPIAAFAADDAYCNAGSITGSRTKNTIRIRQRLLVRALESVGIRRDACGEFYKRRDRTWHK